MFVPLISLLHHVRRFPNYLIWWSLLLVGSLVHDVPFFVLALMPPWHIPLDVHLWSNIRFPFLALNNHSCDVFWYHNTCTIYRSLFPMNLICGVWGFGYESSVENLSLDLFSYFVKKGELIWWPSNERFEGATNRLKKVIFWGLWNFAPLTPRSNASLAFFSVLLSLPLL